jgi:DHA1 family bicyclomycin/chloramphenicol resistance-like MFS transporter
VVEGAFLVRGDPVSTDPRPDRPSAAGVAAIVRRRRSDSRIARDLDPVPVSSPRSASADARPTDRALVVLLGALTAFAAMSIDMYLPAFGAIAQTLRTDAAAVQRTLTVFMAGLALGQAVYGPVADRFGRRPALLSGCALYVVASIGCAAAESIGALLAWRFVQALGGCAGVVVARAIVRDLFDATASARVLSWLMLVMGVAPILAPLAGGALLVQAGWRAIFVALAVYGAAALAAVAWRLPETRPADAIRPDVRGAVAGYAGLLRDRATVARMLAAGSAQAGMFAYIAGSPFVFIDLYGVAPQHYGWLFGANACGLIAVSQLNRRWLRQRTPAQLLGSAHAVHALAGLALLAIAVSGFGGLPALLVPLFVVVASLGAVMPNATALAMAPHPTRAGTASALMGALQFSLAVAATGAVSLLHATSARPMAAVIAGCAAVAWALHRVAARASTPTRAPR